MIEVIMPVRNVPHVASLTLTHLWAWGVSAGLVSRVTILDNASTDPEMEPFLEAVAALPRHRVIRHERDVGVWCSINRGLAGAEGLVLVLTSDLLSGPTTIPALLAAQEHARLAFVSPDNAAPGLGMHAQIWHSPATPLTLLGGYHGACWLMDWPRLREGVGWYDPQFYVCYGDTDYSERLRLKAQETGDQTWAPWLVQGLTVCHLDKQSRRRDNTAEGDLRVEVEDGRRFREKWREHAEILARHPEVPAGEILSHHAHQLGGWDEGRVA